MNKRLRKQIIIALVFFALLGSVGTGIYLALRPPASCFDNRKNQGETGLDCGGPCVPCNLKENPPLLVKQTPLLLKSSNNKINVLIQFSNLDSEWGAQEFTYHLIFTGSNGETQQLDYSDFILPHEVKTVVLPQLDTNFIPQAATLTIDYSQIKWAKPIEGVNLTGGNPFIFNGTVKVLEPSTSTAIARNTYTFTKTLRLGMTDAEVFNLQKVLSLDPNIYPEGKITGYFGKATEAAVKRFQQKYGIRVTGEVGPQTRAKLNELYGPKNVQTFDYVFDTKQVLKLGMKGIEVQKLQEALALDSGYSPQGVVSGTFDKATETAVKEFQKKYGLPVTGQVGSQTAEKLNEIISQYQNQTAAPIPETFEPYEATLKVEGNIYNSTPFSWKKGEVVVALCDKNNNYQTVNKLPLDNLETGKIIPFSLSWHYEVPSGLKVCVKEVHVNVLDVNNAYLPKQ